MTETLLLVDQTGYDPVLGAEKVSCSGGESHGDGERLVAVGLEREERSREGSRAGLSCVSQCHCREGLNERVNITALSPPDTLSRMESISHSQKTR